MPKKKLSIKEQIAHMAEKGLEFKINSEAQEILTNSTYFFKIKSFAKNYPKPYQGIDFAHLFELSKIDLIFRELVLKLTLNIEHALKIAILNHFTSLENDKDLTKDFLNSTYGQSAKNYLKSMIKRAKESNTNRYSTQRLLSKTDEKEPEFWVLIEVLQLGDLIKLYDFFYTRYKQFYTKDEINFLNSATYSLKCLRNSAAHNNCILTNICDKSGNAQKYILNKLSPFRLKIEKSIKQDNIENMLLNYPISDFLSCVMLAEFIIKNDGSKNHLRREIKRFFTKECYKKSRRKLFYKQNKIRERSIIVYRSFRVIINKF